MIYKKSAIQLLLAVILLLTAIPFASAASTAKTVYVNGSKVQYAQGPIVEDGITLVSAKETFEAMGLKFQWDKSNNRMIGTSSSGETTIAIIVGDFTATINGMYLVLDAPAVAKNGRMMVPLRFLAQSLGATVSNKGNTITIKTVAENKGPYYTGLPLEITNTYVRNRSKHTVTVEYKEFAADASQSFANTYAVTLMPGKKGVFERAQLRPGYEVGSSEPGNFMGRGVTSVTWKSDGVEKRLESKSYNKAEKHFFSGDFEKELLVQTEKVRKAKEAEEKRSQKESLVKNKNVPLLADPAYVVTEAYSTPQAHIALMNLSDKTIISAELTFNTYDVYGDPVGDPIDGILKFTVNTRVIELKSGHTRYFYWDLHGRDETHSIRNVTVTKVAFSDGTVWKKK